MSFDHPVLGLHDRAMPTLEDAERTHELYPRWGSIAPLPNARMMLHVGAESVENFLVVGDAWGQLVASQLEGPSRILDIGCGCGRTARTLLQNPWVTEYFGFDVVPVYPAWCNRWLSPLARGKFSFMHVDVHSERYNPQGRYRGSEVEFPYATGSLDLAFAASLFTHLFEADARRYLAEAARVVRPGGKLIASFHDRPSSGVYSGDEHRADVAPDYFEDMARASGWGGVSAKLDDVCGQHVLVLVRRA